jgi:hypothetical protein
MILLTPAPTKRARSSVGNLASAFQLTTAAASGTYPFTLGMGFAKGDAPSNVTTDLATAQVVVKRRWNDGSVKHAIIAGRAALTQNIARTINLSAGAQASGTALTASDIQSANPSASVQCGALGTVSLSGLLGSPLRTWISGPEMVECHYRADVGVGTLMSVWFHVRLFADGRKWVRAIVENGYVEESNVDRTYVPTVTIGGVTVYNNGGSNLVHCKQTRWMAEGWIGGDPQITPKHDVAYLRSSKLSPNYFWTDASASTLNGQTQTYTPMANGQIDAAMGAGGFGPFIGLLTNWDAIYCATGDARALRAVLANAGHYNSFPVIFRDSTTQLPIKPSEHASVALNGGGYDYGSSAGLVFDIPHHPSPAYLAYLITGDYWHYETLLNVCAALYAMPGTGHGLGLNRWLRPTVRGTGWTLRSLAQLCALAPTGDAVAAEYQTLLANNYTSWKGVVDTPGLNQLGTLFEYEMGSHAYDTPGAIAPWQVDFWVASNGHASDIEPLSDMTTLDAVRDWMYRWPVGILGRSGVSADFDFTRAAQYNINIWSDWVDDPTVWFDSWGDVHTQTFGSANTVTTNTLQGESGALPSIPSGYWANRMPAIAFAVDHGAPGAQAAFDRFVGADNWPSLRDSGFGDTPVWGVMPRSWPG